MRKALRKHKNDILWTITYAAGLTCISAGCMLDGTTWIPFIIFVVSFTWLVLFGKANGYME